MYSVSKVDNKKLSQVAESVRWAMHMEGNGGITRLNLFEGPPSEGGSIAGMAGSKSMTPEQRQVIESFRRRIENRVRAYVMERSGSVAVSVDLEDKLVKVRLAAGDFFEPGEAALRPQALPVLDAIAEELVPTHQPITVEGHTDDQLVHNGRFRDNWELSTSRAATVASFLERAHQMPAELLTASGFASSRPISREDSPEAREANRRVELVMELELPEAPVQRAGSSRGEPSLKPVAP
jgi:chemotaxis protein MotB